MEQDRHNRRPKRRANGGPPDVAWDAATDRSIAPRRAALRMLGQVVAHKRMLSHLRPDHGLDPAEAARAARLAQTVLRHMGPLDQVIGQFVERMPAPAVRMILRLGAAELLIAGEDAHGVVNAAVGLAKSGGQKMARSSGLVNAVLRRIAEEGPALWAAHAPQRLPVWIAGPVRKAAGEDRLRAIEAAHEAGAPLDLTPRDGATVIPGAERLPTGSLRVSDAGQVSALPGFAEGAWWVQDAAAALPVKLLGDVRGQRVLDMCAAPGGKTLQLAAAGAEVVALDASDTRLDRLRENLARTGLSARIVVGDALEHGDRYDAILLDAPCTATGTLRRHPDLPFVKSGRETEALTRLQMRLLDHALSLLNPGGRLVFCTCSLLAVEGEFQVKAALKRHAGLSVVPVDPVSLGGDADWASAEGGLRLWPDMWADRGGIDGFYMACLTHDGSGSGE
jgi:16S rRNA (cytosine967-C5)-methyltransferase